MDINAHNVESIEITECRALNTSTGAVYSRTIRINSGATPDYITLYSDDPNKLNIVGVEGVV